MNLHLNHVKFRKFNVAFPYDKIIFKKLNISFRYLVILFEKSFYAKNRNIH